MIIHFPTAPFVHFLFITSILYFELFEGGAKEIE